MSLPLLALSDAQRAAQGQTDPQKLPWHKRRLLCFTEEERSKATNRIQAPEEPVIEIVDFITNAVKRGICNCNLEPEVVYDSERTKLVALFESELHYNKFMMQLMVCTLMNMSNIAPNSMTAKIRQHLIGAHSGSGSSDESIKLSAENFINKAHYALSVAFVAGGTAAAVGTALAVVAGAAGGFLAGVCAILAIAVAWGMGYEMSLEWFSNNWRSTIGTDTKATEEVRTAFKELKASPETKEQTALQGFFEKFFVEHKRRVHDAIFKIKINDMTGKPDKWLGEPIEIIRVGHKSRARDVHDYKKDSVITLNVPGGPFRLQGMGRLETIYEGDEKSAELAAAFGMNSLALTRFMMTR